MTNSPTPIAALWKRFRGDAAAMLALALGIAAVTWYGFHQGTFLGRLDAVSQYIPWYTFLGEQLRAGNIPGWNPFSMSGAPFAGDPQSGWGYLPVMAIFTFFSGQTGFQVMIVFHLALAASGSYLFARVVGLGVFGSTAAAAVFTFPGMVERSRCCTIHVEAAVWIPVAFLGIELGSRSQSWERRTAAWGLTAIATSQIIAGWIGQGAAYGLVAVAAYAGYRILLAPEPHERSWRSRGVNFAAMFGVAGAITAVLAATAILPRLDVIDRSNLAGGSYDLVSGTADETGGWALRDLPSRLLTETNQAGRFYWGGAVFALAILAPLLTRRRYQMSFFLPFFVIVLILTLKDTVVHHAFYLIPSFKQFHGHRPDRILTILPLGAAMLAGSTVASLTSWTSRRRWLAAVAAIPVVGVLIFWDWLRDGLTPISTETVIVVIVVAVAIAVIMLRPARGVVIGAVLILIASVFWDPSLSDVTFQRGNLPSGASPTTVQTYETTDPVAAFLQQKQSEGPPFRFFGYDPGLLVFNGDIRTYHVSYSDPRTLALLVNNRAVELGLQDVQGYNPVQIQRYVEYIIGVNDQDQSYHAANVLFHGPTSPLLDLLNVRYIIVPRDIPAGRPDLLHLSQQYPTVYVDGSVRVLERTTALARAWIVHEVQAVATDADAISKLKNRQVDPRVTALIPADELLPIVAEATNAAESVNVDRYEPDSIQLTANLSANGLVVLSELWDPGWRARIDGKSVDVKRVDAIFRGIEVPAGEHVIELEYAPRTLFVTAVVSGVGWFGVLVGYSLVAGSWLAWLFGFRPRHHEKLGEHAPVWAHHSWPRPESRPRVHGLRSDIEGGDGEPEPKWLETAPALPERFLYEGEPPPLASEIGVETEPNIEEGLLVKSGRRCPWYLTTWPKARKSDKRS